MRAAIAVSLVAVAIGLVALATDTACSSVPNQFCRGRDINRKGGADSPDRDCTVCVEEQCCDLVGECQGTDCATKVAGAHACVLDAGRGAGAAEPGCTDPLNDAPSRDTYQCMRSRCGERCGLPVCKLDPLVPRLGDVDCDRCFAGSCCPEMNACAKNRSCLLALECIITKCRDQLGRNLTRAAHPAAVDLATRACAADDAGPPPGAGDCVSECIGEFAAGGTEEAAEGRCLAAKVNECGADVECGDECAPEADGGRD